MPRPNFTQIGYPNGLNLLKFYNKNRDSFIDIDRTLVSVTMGVTRRLVQSQSHIPYTIDPSELEKILKDYLLAEAGWQTLLSKKPHLSYKQYDMVTDNMAGYIAWDAFTGIVRAKYCKQLV